VVGLLAYIIDHLLLGDRLCGVVDVNMYIVKKILSFRHMTSTAASCKEQCNDDN
jgi:hypothetical protein